MLTLITGNAGKAKQAQQYLGMPLAHRSIDLPEIQSLDSKEITEGKARAAYEIVQGPVIVEDVSLVFHAFGKLPGPFIKWFEKELGHEGLCRLLDGKDRAITNTVTYTYYDGKTMKTFQESADGTMAQHPRGNGFGWDVIFIPKGHSITRAEMTPEEYDPLQPRKKVLEELKKFLEKQP
jgi:non-canonical purine NTP pyrophosphatase (RdgB/HAM1 family)